MQQSELQSCHSVESIQQGLSSRNICLKSVLICIELPVPKKLLFFFIFFLKGPISLGMLPEYLFLRLNYSSVSTCCMRVWNLSCFRATFKHSLTYTNDQYSAVVHQLTTTVCQVLKLHKKKRALLSNPFSFAFCFSDHHHTLRWPLVVNWVGTSAKVSPETQGSLSAQSLCYNQ